jgi:hypothetical protein
LHDVNKAHADGMCAPFFSFFIYFHRASQACKCYKEKKICKRRYIFLEADKDLNGHRVGQLNGTATKELGTKTLYCFIPYTTSCKRVETAHSLETGGTVRKQNKKEREKDRTEQNRSLNKMQRWNSKEKLRVKAAAVW